MVTAEIVDYAYPCMMAEKALKDLHAAMLHNDYDEAMEHALIAMAEAKLTYNAIRYAKGTDK
jgi:hypothetical protein